MTKPKSRRAPLTLDEIAPAGGAEAAALAESAPASPARPAEREPTTVVYARVPWSVGQKLRDLAHKRSRSERRRVTVQELVAEAIENLASK